MKLLEIKLLTDENISPKVVTFLRQSGFDVIDTKEQQWFGTSEFVFANRFFSWQWTFFLGQFWLLRKHEYGSVTDQIVNNFKIRIMIVPDNHETSR